MNEVYMQTRNTSEEFQVREPKFVKLYYEAVGKLHGLNGTQVKIMTFMLRHMNYKNEVFYRERDKKSFCEEDKIKVSAFNNNVTTMTKSGLIKRQGNNDFTFNPKYLTKACWSEVQSIKLEQNFTVEGVENKVIIDEKELPY